MAQHRINWSRHEEKLMRRARDERRTNKDIAEMLNRVFYCGQSVRTLDDVWAHFKNVPAPYGPNCNKLFGQGNSTAQIASKLGYFESDVYNSLARFAGVVE